MCMECRNDYLQQVSSAHNTLDFCSVQCESAQLEMEKVRAERTEERKHYTAEEKVAILRRHLLDRVAVSDLCEELGLRPTVFYRWQKEFFENGAAAFQAQERPHRQVEEKQKRIAFLEKKVQTKDEVLAELMAEHMALKKSLGEL